MSDAIKRDRRLAILPASAVPRRDFEGQAAAVLPAIDAKVATAKLSASRPHRLVENAAQRMPAAGQQKSALAVSELGPARR